MESIVHVTTSRGVTDCKYNNLPEGASVIEDVMEGGPIKLKFSQFLEKGEDQIMGEAMLKRAKRLGGRLGLRTANKIIEQPSVVPGEFRDHVLLFPGFLVELLRPEKRLRCIPVLYPEAGKYELDFLWLGHESIGKGCLLVLEE